AELHVAVDVWVIGRIDLRNQCLEPILVSQEMKMGGPHIVATLSPQKVADRPVDGDRITGRLDRAETEMALRVGDELAAQIHVRLRWVLVFVKAFRRGMPDIDLDALDRLTVDIAV